MREQLGDEAQALFDSLSQPPTVGLRVNTTKLSGAEFDALNTWQSERVPWCPSGRVLTEETSAGKHPHHAAGLYYLQDPSAMAVAEALAPQAGDWVLDLAAAPGGKSTHLYSLMQGAGLLVANDINRNRASALVENLERWGAKNILVMNESVERLAQSWGACFDRVLLDAPCSGEGMFRKSEAALTMWSEETVATCAVRQNELLAHAAQLVKPGGMLAYSTCTLNTDENEEVIEQFLKNHAEFELVRLELSQTSHGFSSSEPTQHALRLWSHRNVGEGHFVAVLKRTAGRLKRVKQYEPKPVAKADKILWQHFCTDTGLNPERHLARYGDKLYALPAELPDFANLKAVRAGVQLGELKKGRLEPAHALALSLTKSELKTVPILELNLEESRRYLQGKVLDASGKKGWLVLTLDGFALGWGKRSGSVVKNAYPKSLRR